MDLRAEIRSPSGCRSPRHRTSLRRMSSPYPDSPPAGTVPARSAKVRVALNFLAWLAVACVAILLAALLTRQASQDQLRANAERSALNWAEIVKYSVPDLEAGFKSGKFTPTSLQRLRDLL